MSTKSFASTKISESGASKFGVSVEYMVLGGGGGAGSAYSGGGGAGGIAYGTKLIKLLVPYTTTIGAGGSGMGENSECIGIIGYGGGSTNATGGSGGGGMGWNGPNQLGGSCIAGQGNPGGVGYGVANNNAAGGGGGGYGSIGFAAMSYNGSGGNGGNGGDPMGLGSTYARGGGGSYHGSSTPSAANTGNGGNSFAFSSGQSGSSGVIVLRYNSAYVISLSAGLTGSTTTSGSLKTTTITQGTGTVTFA